MDLSQIIHRRKTENIKMFYSIPANVVNVNHLKYHLK